MKLKMKKFVAIISAIAVAVTIIPFTGMKTFAHNQEQNIQIVANDKWKALEKELLELQSKKKIATRSVGNATFITKEEFFALAEKYDGAERTVKVGKSSYYSEKLVNGGYNAFANSKSGMVHLRDDYGTCATLLVTDGVLGGAIAGGPAGALIGAIASNLLASYFRAANNHMKEWINVGSSKGGCRITLTDEFPIAKLDTVQQSPIKKL